VHPGVVRIPNSMLRTDLSNLGSNVGVPSTRHTGEQMVLHLEVQSSGQGSCNESSVSRRSLYLGLEPADSLPIVAYGFGGVTVDVLEVVAECEEGCEGQTLGRSHGEDVRHGDVPVLKSVVHEWSDDVEVDVEQTAGGGYDSSAFQKCIVLTDSHLGRTGVLEGECLGVQDHGKPVSRKDRQEVKSLEIVHELSLGVALGVIIEQQHGFRIHSIRVQFVMIGKGMMRPVLHRPIVFASSNRIRSKSEQIIHPRFPGSRSVIRIVLDVEADECLCDSERDGDLHGGLLGGPEVVEGAVEADVEHGAGEVAGGSEFSSTADDFEYFPLDLAFEIGVEYVTVNVYGIKKEKKYSAHTYSS
jgi:hypothetical protein